MADLFVHDYRLTLPRRDGGVATEEPRDVTGSVFVCKEAQYPFEMQIDNGRWFRMDQGLGFKMPGNFTRLSFRSSNDDADTRIVVYVASGEVFDARLNIVRDPEHFQELVAGIQPSYLTWHDQLGPIPFTMGGTEALGTVQYNPNGLDETTAVYLPGAATIADAEELREYFEIDDRNMPTGTFRQALRKWVRFFNTGETDIWVLNLRGTLDNESVDASQCDLMAVVKVGGPAVTLFTTDNLLVVAAPATPAPLAAAVKVVISQAFDAPTILHWQYFPGGS